MTPTRVSRIAWLDVILMWRNRSALFSVFGLPVFFAVLTLTLKGKKVAGVDLAVFAATGYLAYFLVFAVFAYLLGVFTARREDLSLKRLRGTALSDAEIFGGSVLVSAVVYLIQAVLLMGILRAALGGGLPANPPLMLAGMAAGVAVFALLAFAISGLTRTAEMAQLTALPVIFLCLAASGTMFSLENAPEAVRFVAHALPLTPVVEIIRTAYLGRDYAFEGHHAAVGFFEAWALCWQSYIMLAMWMGIGHLAAKRWFRWEPRHA